MSHTHIRYLRWQPPSKAFCNLNDIETVVYAYDTEFKVHNSGSHFLMISLKEEPTVERVAFVGID